jgi:hypothetical protein
MQLSCREARFAVSRELDGALSAAECEQLMLHLSSCDDCGAFARGQQALRGALWVLAAVSLPPRLRTFTAERKVPAAPASLT